MELKHKAAMVAAISTLAVLAITYSAFADERVDPAELFAHRFADTLSRGYADLILLQDEMPGDDDLRGYTLDYYVLTHPETTDPLCLPVPIMAALFPDNDALVVIGESKTFSELHGGSGDLVILGNSDVSSTYAEGWFVPDHMASTVCSWAIILAYPDGTTY